MLQGRRIAFDYGDVRIGVAVSDLSGLLATPLANLEAQAENLLDQISGLFSEYSPIYVAIGKPLHLSGSGSIKDEQVSDFVKDICQRTSAPIYAVDERLTTVSAEKLLRSKGVNSKDSKSLIDGMAAAAILESALNQERIQGEPMNRIR